MPSFGIQLRWPIELIDPAIILFYAVQVYIQTLLDGLRQGSIPFGLRDRAFGRFWEKISGQPADPSVPLAGSATLVPPIFAQASGTVLEIGPGSGNQTCYYEANTTQITRIYGAEPVRELHTLLRKNVNATSLGAKYHVLAADATKASIARELVNRNDKITGASGEINEIFDTIICVRVLCSVPDLDRTICDLHEMLKPGGKLLIVEHTVNRWQDPKGSIAARICQGVYMLLGWQYFVGNCSLTRDIESQLRTDSARRWDSIDIDRHFGRAVLTYISGVLVKR